MVSLIFIKSISYKMKIFKLNILILFLSVSFIANSQDKKVSFGIKTGVNFSKYNKDIQYSEYKGKVGFYVGGLANISISEKFKIQPELLFALQGSTFLIKDLEILESPEEPPVVGDFKTHITESTIVIPIMAQYYISEKFYFEAGPQLGLIVNNKEEVKESPTDDPTFSVVYEYDADVFDIGLSFGAGLKVSENIIINARYFLGLIERDFRQVKSSVINLGAEYRF